MDNDSKVTILGSIKNLAALAALFGLPEITPEYQMKVFTVVGVAYLGLGIIKDLYTNKPDSASVMDIVSKLAEVVKAKPGS
jgi:hypothetical protein